MGGKLLENCTCRQSLAEYKEKTKELIEEFAWADFLSCYDKMEVIESVRDKDSFGDADILYSTNDDIPFTVMDLQEEFNPKEIIKNGDVISFEYKEMQVDMIHIKRESYSYAKAYYGKADLGNYIGKLARYFGLSHGHDGLFIKMRDENDNLFAKVLVTRDHDETLKFLGLDPNIFAAGFDTVDDVFKYVASSVYYSPANYLLENISAVGRVRDRKRENYKKFLEFGKTQTGNYLPKVEDKTIFLGKIFNTFPGTVERFTQAMMKMTFAKAVKEKFNGNIVSELTGLSNKSLGKFMAALREDPRFSPVILMHTKDEIIAKNILVAYSTHMSV